MNQDIFPLVIGLTISICVLAYLARNRAPRLAEVVGWSSGIVASLVFVAMVTIDAFQPELADSLQHLAMPAPAVRTTAYWVAFCLHLAIGTFGATYCAIRLASRRRARLVSDQA